MDSLVASKTSVPLPAHAYEKYRGKWIALDADGTSILASADSLSVLEDQLLAAGEDPREVIFDRVARIAASTCFRPGRSIVLPVTLSVYQTTGSTLNWDNDYWETRYVNGYPGGTRGQIGGLGG